MAAATTLSTTDGEMGLLAAEPSASPKGGVVVVQEAFGLTDHIGSVCDRLAAEGWLAVAPALYHRQGAPTFTLAEFGQLRELMGQLTGDGIRADVDAAVGWLRTHGIAEERVGIIGFCMGGGITLDAAGRRRLGAAVTFYGGGVLEGRFGLPSGIESAGTLQTPWLGLYGDLDKGIPPEQVEQLREVASGASVPTEVVRYPDADHGFHNDDRPDVHHEGAAEDAWRRTLSWLDLYAGPDPASGPD